MRGLIKSITREFEGGGYVLTLGNLPFQAAQEYAKLKDSEIDITIKKYYEKRSLNANAYAWVLIAKIAQALSTSNDEVYRDMLASYGTPLKDDNGNAVIYSVRSDITLSGDMWIHSKRIGAGEVNGTEFAHYMHMKGSSKCDSAEMHRLIDGIVSDAKALGIETKTPDELARLQYE